MQENFRKLTLLVFACGVILRIALALVNYEANDDHLNVIRIMAYENRLPEREIGNKRDESFQPKLYHATVAAFLKILQTQSHWLQIHIAQLISCAAGIVTLLLAHRFIMGEVALSKKVRFISFSLLALNPVLIGINAQATNDSFVILCVSLALYFGCLFFEKQRTVDFCWMLISAVLAGLAKGNGLVVFIAILAVFAIPLYRRPNRNYPAASTSALYGSIFVVSYLALVPSLGPYWQLYREYGSPFVINWDPAPFPYLFEKTFPEQIRPGVTSIIDSFFTFRLLDMLRNPVITNEREYYPAHRTSLWSQLYGNAQFVHFAAWPPSWQLPTSRYQWATRLVLNVGRLLFVCALLPSVLMLAALWRRIGSAVRFLKGTQAPGSRLADWLLDFAVFGYILFVIVYSLRYRDFSFMKAIFIFPALFGFLMLFARECESLYARCAQKKIFRFSADVIFIFLLFLYVVDVIALIGQLTLRSLSP